MIRQRHPKTGAIVTLLLIASMTSRAAGADDRQTGQGGPIQLYATVPVGPIGIVSSHGAAKINGRAVYGEQTVWRGDLIQAPNDSSARVLLDSIGQITLATGAIITLTTTLSNKHNEIVSPVLVASVTEGEINVRLQPEASAHIETRSSVIKADKGAWFSLIVEGREAQVYALVGELHVEPQTQKDGLIGLMGEPNPNTSSFQATSKTIYVNPNGTKPLGIKVEKTNKTGRRSKRFVPVQDEPVKNLLIRFSLEPPTIGRVDPQETLTNDLGIAETTFTAGSDKGKGTFKATIVEKPEYKDLYSGFSTYERKIVVGKPPGPFRLRNILIAAGLIGGVIIICCRPTSNPEQDPPIIIEP